MEKIPTLFVRNPVQKKLVTTEVNPEAAWVLAGHGVPTRKLDGINICVTILGGECAFVQKRRNPTPFEKMAGAEPGYVEAHRSDPADQHIFAAIDATNFYDWPDGANSCEALGPKIQGGVESDTPYLYPFLFRPLQLLDFTKLPTFEYIQDYLITHTIEGIVWQDRQRRRYAKIKRRDFGLPWPVK